MLAFLIFALATWTVVCNLGVALGISFSTVRLALLPSLVCGIAGAAWMGRDDPGAGVRGPAIDARQLHRPGLLLATCSVGLYWATGSYLLFWALAVALLSFAWATSRGSGSGFDGSRQLSAGERGALGCLCALAVVITAISHRPDIDDAFYLSVPVQALEHPELPVLTSDGMYGEPGLRLLSSVYKVDSYALLVGSLAWHLSKTPIQIAHLVLPLFWGLFFVLAWAALARALLGRFWLPVLVLVLFFAVVLGEVHRGFGNFAFVRFQQGKAVLANVAVPLVFLYALRFGASGRRVDWAALLAAVVGAVGLSSSALFVAPAASMLGIAGALPLARKSIGRILLAAAPCFYCLLAVIAIRRGMRGSPFFAGPSAGPIEQTVSNVLGPVSVYPLLLAILGAWTVAAPGPVRRFLALVPLLFFLVPLNPALTELVARHFSRPEFWRVFWCLPFFLFPAIFVFGLLNAGFRSGPVVWRAAVVALAGASIAVLLSQRSALARSNATEIARPSLKVDRGPYAVAGFVRDRVAPGTSVLAPETVSAWLATLEHHPRLVVVRAHYLDLPEVSFGAKDVAARKELAAIVNWDRSDPESSSRLIDALGRYRVGALVLGADTSLNSVLSARLTDRKFERHDLCGYSVWTRRVPDGEFASEGNAR